MKLLSSILALLGLILFFIPPKAFAQCTPIYGGGETCVNPVITVNKKILDPSTNAYVHDLGINDRRFHEGDPINFQITVTNTGTAAAGNFTVKDILPQYITQSNPPFDPTTSTISFQSGGLAPGASQVFSVAATVGQRNSFPANEAVFCVNNEAQVSSNDNIAGQDFSQFCIEQKVATTTVAPTPTSILEQNNPTVAPPSSPTQLPPTGASAQSVLLPLSMGALGIVFRWISKKTIMKI